MPSVPYIAGNSIIRERDSRGVGTSADPDIFGFFDQTTHDKLDAIATITNNISLKLPSGLVSDRLKAQAVITATSPNDFNAMGTANLGNIKNAPGQIFSLTCTNLNAATRYLLLINKSSNPVAGDTPIRSFPVYGGGGFLCLGTDVFGSIEAGIGLFFPAGISWGFSSTPLILTPATATDCIFATRWL